MFVYDESVSVKLLYEVYFCCEHVVPKVHVFFACEPLICCVFVGAQSLSTRGEILDGLYWEEDGLCGGFLVVQ